MKPIISSGWLFPGAYFLLFSLVLAGGCSKHPTVSDEKHVQATSLLGQGDTKDDAGDKAGALELYEKAKEIWPDNPNIYGRIAKVASDLGKRDIGLEAIGKLEALWPEANTNEQVKALKNHLEAIGVAPQQPASNAIQEFNSTDRIKYDALLLISKDLDSAKTPNETIKLTYELLDKSGEFLTDKQDRQDMAAVWGLRAEAAMQLKERLLAQEAGQKMLLSKADESQDLHLRETLAKLERNDLLIEIKPTDWATTNKGLLKRAMAGNHYSQDGLGKELRADNPDQSAFWFRKASEAGNEDAMFYLGLAYENGGGELSRNYDESFKWYQKSAEKGNSDAMNNIGIFYENGLGGVGVDKHEAFSWYKKAADNGNTLAMTNVAIYYDYGLGGVEKNEQEAATWRAKAANAGLNKFREYMKLYDNEWDEMLATNNYQRMLAFSQVLCKKLDDLVELDSNYTQLVIPEKEKWEGRHNEAAKLLAK